MLPELRCPQCGEPLERGGVCQCGLDPTLLFAVVESAERLARQAAALAGAGQWQEAANAAAESLRLQTSGNDLAALVLLAARVAGASGGPASVPEPDPQKLPETLREASDRVVTSVRQLRGLGRDKTATGEELRTALEEISTQWGGLAWLDPRAGAQGAGAATGLRQRWVLIAGFAVVLAIGLVGGTFVSRGVGGRAGRVEVETPKSAEPQPVPENATTSALKHEVATLQRESERLQSRGALQAAILRSDWTGAAAALRSMPEAERDGIIREAIPANQGRRIYLAALDASRVGAFDDAAVLFRASLAISPDSAYFHDDALYYQARALQRLGKSAEAVVTYTLLIEGWPGSTYVEDAQRFRVELEKRQP